MNQFQSLCVKILQIPKMPVRNITRITLKINLQKTIFGHSSHNIEWNSACNNMARNRFEFTVITNAILILIQK